MKIILRKENTEKRLLRTILNSTWVDHISLIKIISFCKIMIFLYWKGCSYKPARTSGFERLWFTRWKQKNPKMVMSIGSGCLLPPRCLSELVLPSRRGPSLWLSCSKEPMTWTWSVVSPREWIEDNNELMAKQYTRCHQCGYPAGICQGFSPKVVLREFHLQRDFTWVLTWLKNRKKK